MFGLLPSFSTSNFVHLEVESNGSSSISTASRASASLYDIVLELKGLDHDIAFSSFSAEHSCYILRLLILGHLNSGTMKDNQISVRIIQLCI
jgi:hypothetical protein